MANARNFLIALDDGHGMETPGKRTPYIASLGREIKENEFNRAVVKYLDEELRRCGFRTLLVAPTDKDVPLKKRTDLANAKGADAYISIHYNAFDGKFNGPGKDPEGHSIHIYPGSKSGRKLAECILKYLRQGTPQKNRGIQENNFHVLRETKMPAVLSENGFMDNMREALLMINKQFQKEVAIEHAKGICDYFGVKYVPKATPVKKPTSTGNKIYKVQTGAFKVKGYADKLAKELKKDGYDTFIVHDKYYKVQTGAFSVRKNAEKLAMELRKKGYSVFIVEVGK
jgi:N-acetylmuramoyl-L-alanine amidase